MGGSGENYEITQYYNYNHSIRRLTWSVRWLPGVWGGIAHGSRVGVTAASEAE